MYKKMLFILAVLFVFVICMNTKAQTAYTFDGAFFTYGTIDLSTGGFTSINFLPQGSSYYPVTADNNEVDGQYTIMSNFGYPATYYLSHVNFTTLTADSIAPVGALASGQIYIKGMAFNAVTDTWYVISGDDFGTAAYLYTINIETGVLTEVGQIQNASLPVGIAIDCDGNAYIINIVSGFSSTAVLNSLNLTTAAATAIGTDLGLALVTGFSQDMDFNPDNGNLYWSGYWSDGFFSEGGSFRLVDVTTGTSTEISAFAQFETITGFDVNATCQIVPVELQSFTASVNENNVSLHWNTATETNNSGFSVERKSNQSDWHSIGFVPGFGSSTEPRSYSYNDVQLNAGSYTYRLKQVDFNGSFEYSNEVEVEIANPSGYQLSQNYPNPFNPSTTIEFSIPNNEFVNLIVYNSLGQQVAVLVNNVLTSGSHSVNFDARILASGIYIAKLTAGNYTNLIKMNLLK